MYSKLRLGMTVAAIGGTALATLLASACSSDRGAFEGPPGPFPDASPADGATCSYRCSRDLKKVTRTCDGETEETIATCGPDQGCGIDKCVDACQAAALSKGSVGCSFWTLPPDDVAIAPGACFVAMIANTWDRPVTLGAELGSARLDISKSVYTASTEGDTPVYTQLSGAVPPGAVALVFLSQVDSPDSGGERWRCPPGVVPAHKAEAVAGGTLRTHAFHITADAPVAAYSIFPYGGAESHMPSASLLLPVSSWDTAYVAVSTGRFGPDDPYVAEDPRTLQIIANEDGTEVSMRPIEAVLEGIGVEPAAAGAPATWTLSRGEVLQITQIPTLSGSPISSNKPIGVFGGSPCIFLPNASGACDVTQQQIPPFAQWGTEYALVPFKPRTVSVTSVARENVPWTIVGAVDGTVLAYDPEQPPGAPETLSAGQVANFITDARVTVKSQDSRHPFYAAVHMTGGTYGGGATHGNTTIGDPDFVTVVPSDQFLDRYVFFTDYTFPDTTIVVVRRKTAGRFHPVVLDCAGELTGFVPLGTKGEYEYAFVDLTKGAVPQKFDKGQCGYGRHEAESDGPFSITVWGLGPWASYGYAGGMGSRPVNDAPPPVVR
ncbi:MAG: IgGFc-binding protein [Labilithrix sp.]|nr:IgGFc-binding protein [Labilithrix sp.]